jgi:16S rRNA (guanine(966)-N(2))-methyltransferase RsmD
MSRIVAGALRGRILLAPRGLGTRPTSDKVRQAVMNVLGQSFDGGEVLDLYAGSGALALEALSRGCARAVCVDSAREAAETIRRNAAALGLSDRVEVRCERVEDVLPGLPRERFALVFLDPPYRTGPEAALAAAGACLAPGGRLVAEHDARRPTPAEAGPLRLLDRRRFGDTGISIYGRE